MHNIPNHVIALTDRPVTEVIHQGNVTYTEIGAEWIRLLHEKWRVDAIVCMGECHTELVFQEVKNGLFGRTKKKPEKFIKIAQLTVYYRQRPDIDPTLWMLQQTEMGQALFDLLTKRNMLPEFPHFLSCTPDETEYWQLHRYKNDKYAVLREKKEQLDIPTDPQIQYSIHFESFDALALWHIYASTRGAVEFHLKKKFAGRVGVKVYGPSEGHYIVLDSREFLDTFTADAASYEQAVQEIRQITKQKDLWGALALCGYRAIFCTWDSLTPEQHFHLLRD
jgi:hypothetical protein